MILAITYTTWNLVANGRLEWFGTTAFLSSTALMWWLAVYITMVLKKQGGELPEDSLTADIDDGEPEVGFFYASSWWPISLAAACSMIFLGIAIGPWLVLLSLPFLILTVVGWVYEDYRGQYAR